MIWIALAIVFAGYTIREGILLAANTIHKITITDKEGNSHVPPRRTK